LKLLVDSFLYKDLLFLEEVTKPILFEKILKALALCLVQGLLKAATSKKQIKNPICSDWFEFCYLLANSTYPYVLT
jgi:hypothetical protein